MDKDSADHTLGILTKRRDRFRSHISWNNQEFLPETYQLSYSS